jgi:hypothetical protein
MRFAGILLLVLLVGRAVAQTEPHAFLYGTWVGGIFPPPANVPAQCAAPTLIVTRDVVMRSTLMDVAYRQRIIAGVQAVPGGNGVIIRFVPVAAPGPLTGSGQPDLGFGCGDPNTLRVQRRADGSIIFPACGDFPAPAVRCGAR